MRKGIYKKCLICETSFYSYPSYEKYKNTKFCSKECMGISMRGKGNHNYKKFGELASGWKGGIKTGKKYEYLYMPEHPFCYKDGYILVHRYCAEAYLGRLLDPKEVIHHINENKTDNRPENLYLFNTVNEHSSYHVNLKNGKTKPITKSNLPL